MFLLASSDSHHHRRDMFGNTKANPGVSLGLGDISPLAKPALSDHGSVSFAGGKASSEMSIDSNNTSTTVRAPFGELQVWIRDLHDQTSTTPVAVYAGPCTHNPMHTCLICTYLLWTSSV